MIESVTIAAHYHSDGLTARLRTALKSAGMESGLLSVEQLAPIDQFHSRGLAATIELGRQLAPSPGDRVLDIGSGLGGPSRYLAATYGCHVSGVDLSPSYVEAAIFLSERTGLADKVDYRRADALSLPFQDGAFDAIWTQHVAMNIADRAGLYAEARRVLRPGGRFAVHDVLAGNGEPLHYPVPWSRTAESSFLMTPTAMRKALKAAGFEEISWTEGTQPAIAWFAELQKRQAMALAPPPLGLHLVLGEDFGLMVANLARNLNEGRVALAGAIFTRL